MITTMIGNEYIAPAVEVFEVEAEQMIATSPWVGFEPEDDYGKNDGEVEWTNKRQPNTPWGKSPWE